MHYLLMIYESEATRSGRSQEELGTEYAAYNAFSEDVNKRGIFISGEALMPINAATTVRVRDGKTLTTDGPFAETKEQLGGYYLLNCKDLDEAIALAAKIPAVAHGSIEIRPIMTFE